MVSYVFGRSPANKKVTGSTVPTRLAPLIPSTAVAVTLIVGTILEDRTLRRELPGYVEYTGRVRYRLLPGIW